MFSVDLSFEWYEDAMLFHVHIFISSLESIARYIDKSILKDTLQLKILRTWIKISADSFIHQDLSKHHKEKINEYTFKIITCKKI